MSKKRKPSLYRDDVSAIRSGVGTAVARQFSRMVVTLRGVREMGIWYQRGEEYGLIPMDELDNLLRRYDDNG